MEKSDELRKLVAQFMEVTEDRLKPTFPLTGPRLQGSIGRYALDAAVRRKFGLKSAVVYTATTYGELEAGLLGLETSAQGNLDPLPPFAAENAASAMTSGIPASSLESLSCGIDIELVANLPCVNDYWESDFYSGAFTRSEIAYCLLQEDPRLHFAGRWCVKEALRKCDPAFLQIDFNQIEVNRSVTGSISLVYHNNGQARRLPYAASMSHTSLIATAMVVKQGNSLCWP